MRAVWTRWRDVWRRLSSRGVYPHELAWLLLLPGRGLLFSARRLVDELAPRPDARVLELGPGPGYFSVAVARAIPNGRLALVDLQREMLAKARRRLQRAGAANVSFTQASADRLPFRPGSFDAAFLVAVLGEVGDPGACLAALAHALRPGGTLLVAELPGDPDALSESALRELAEDAGLAFAGAARFRGGFAARFSRSAAVDFPPAHSSNG